MGKIKEVAFGIIVLLIVGAALANALPDAIEKHQRKECLQWNAWAKEKSVVFFLTKNQKEQCDALDIKINAPVRGGFNE